MTERPRFRILLIGDRRLDYRVREDRLAAVPSGYEVVLRRFDGARAPSLREAVVGLEDREPDWVVVEHAEWCGLPVGIEDAAGLTVAIVSDWQRAVPYLSALADAVDVVLLDVAGCRWARAEGIDNAIEFNHEAMCAEPPAQRPRDIDVLHVGHDSPMHCRKWRILSRLSDLPDAYDVQLLCRGSLGRAGVSHEEYMALHARARVVVNHDYRREMNGRCVEAALAGAVLLVERRNLEIERHFTEGAEYLAYSPADVVARVAHVLAHPAEERAIAAAGQRVAASLANPAPLLRLLQLIEERRLGQRAGTRRIARLPRGEAVQRLARIQLGTAASRPRALKVLEALVPHLEAPPWEVAWVEGVIHAAKGLHADLATFRREQLARAAEHYRQAFAAAPGPPQAVLAYNLADISWTLEESAARGQLHAALQALQASPPAGFFWPGCHALFDPRENEYLWLLAGCFERGTPARAAGPWLGRYLRSLVQLRLADLDERAGDLGGCRERLTAAMREGPRRARPLARLALLEAQLGDRSRARRLARLATRVEPTDPVGFHAWAAVAEDRSELTGSLARLARVFPHLAPLRSVLSAGGTA